MNAEIRMNTATDKVVDYMFREEDRHFRENLDEEDKKDPTIFIKKLKEHIFYSVVVLKYKGDANKINEWINIYWEENGEPDEDEEEDYESANCEVCGENYLLDKLEVIDEKFYCRLCNDDNFTCDKCKCVKDREYHISVIGDESGNTICDECVDQYMKENGFENETDF